MILKYVDKWCDLVLIWFRDGWMFVVIIRLDVFLLDEEFCIKIYEYG